MLTKNARAGNLLVINEWGHCFVGSHETTVRWVFDITAKRVIAGDARHSGRWEMLSSSEMEDITESILDNNMAEEFADYNIEKCEAPPFWAATRLA